MSEAKAEGDDDYERQRTKEEEEEKDSDGYEDNRFSTVKKRFVEPSRNSGILFEFRQSRPFSVKSKCSRVTESLGYFLNDSGFL